VCPIDDFIDFEDNLQFPESQNICCNFSFNHNIDYNQYVLKVPYDTKKLLET